MTYLEAINYVLRRLREQPVTDSVETEYSTMIGGYINDARQMVEDAFDWGGLHDELTITTVASTASYTLDGAGEKAHVTQVLDTTNNTTLTQVNADWITKNQEINAVEGPPSYYAFDEVGSDNDPKIVFWPTPDAVYSIKVQTEKSGVDLTNNSTVIPVPSFPVVQFALAMAREERGDVGQAPGTVYEVAYKALSSAINAEAAKRPEKVHWEVK